MKMIYGDKEKQYAKLCKYRVVIKESNMGDTVKIAIEGKVFRDSTCA